MHIIYPNDQYTELTTYVNSILCDITPFKDTVRTSLITRRNAYRKLMEALCNHIYKYIDIGNI